MGNFTTMDRRQMLLRGGAMLALGTMGAPFAALAQGAEKKVFLNYTQKELDDAYDQAPWAPNRVGVINRYKTDSDSVRAKLKFDADVKYGPGEGERLDIFRTSRPKAPIQLFIHGGAWRGQSKEVSAFPAETFVNAGAHYIPVDFFSIPKATLPEMVEQVRRSIVWTYKNAASFGGDPNRIFISGHSSGAHIGGLMVTTDWTKYGLPKNPIKGALLVSGMYDMDPVMLSARSSYVKITKAEQRDLSAVNFIANINCPVVLATGTNETPEFQRQSRDFHALLAKAKKQSAYISVPNMNHFELILQLETHGTPLTQAAFQQMKLTAKV
jgi:arylformamidase